jgi:hypothetical protein
MQLEHYRASDCPSPIPPPQQSTRPPPSGQRQHRSGPGSPRPPWTQATPSPSGHGPQGQPSLTPGARRPRRRVRERLPCRAPDIRSVDAKWRSTRPAVGCPKRSTAGGAHRPTDQERRPRPPQPKGSSPAPPLEESWADVASTRSAQPTEQREQASSQQNGSARGPWNGSRYAPSGSRPGQHLRIPIPGVPRFPRPTSATPQ